MPVGFGKSEDFAYTSSSTASIDFVMDVNGRKGPNSETIDNKMKDIRSFKVARFSTGCDAKIPGIGCVVSLGTSYECISEEPYTNGNNCWAGAKKACENIGMSLPSSIGAFRAVSNDDKTNLGFTSPYQGNFWTAASGMPSMAFIDCISASGSCYAPGSAGKSNTGVSALCVDK